MTKRDAERIEGKVTSILGWKVMRPSSRELFRKAIGKAFNGWGKTDMIEPFTFHYQSAVIFEKALAAFLLSKVVKGGGKGAIAPHVKQDNTLTITIESLGEYEHKDIALAIAAYKD